MALGLVEAARIFVAPALLTVQGLGSYLLSSYVRDTEQGVDVLRRRAWRASLTMISGAALLGSLIVFAAPYVGPFVTGPSFTIDRVTVAGWVLYVTASASFQPFASLAAVKAPAAPGLHLPPDRRSIRGGRSHSSIGQRHERRLDPVRPRRRVVPRRRVRASVRTGAPVQVLRWIHFERTQDEPCVVLLPGCPRASAPSLPAFSSEPRPSAPSPPYRRRR